MKVKDVMTTRVITVKADQTRQQAARLLAQHRISGLPVVDDDNVLVGVVTEHDIIAQGEEGGKTVGDIMTRGVISIAPDTDLEEVSHILVNERIKRLPVLDQGKVIGIVSRADLVKEIAGVKTVVCFERDFVDKELEEAEVMFLAQDNNGDVWLLGAHRRARRARADRQARLAAATVLREQAARRRAAAGLTSWT